METKKTAIINQHYEEPQFEREIYSDPKPIEFVDSPHDQTNYTSKNRTFVPVRFHPKQHYKMNPSYVRTENGMLRLPEDY